MERKTIEKWLVTTVLAASYALLPATGYGNGDTDNIVPHVLYMISHAGVWHLAGNLFVLWIMRGQLYLIPSLAIAFLFSFVPGFSLYGDMGVTMGFSGVLFAIAGIKWGVYCRYAAETGSHRGKTAFSDFCMKALPFALIGIVIPHINWCIHLYCMLAGFVYGRVRR